MAVLVSSHDLDRLGGKATSNSFSDKVQALSSWTRMARGLSFDVTYSSRYWGLQHTLTIIVTSSWLVLGLSMPHFHFDNYVAIGPAHLWGRDS